MSVIDNLNITLPSWITGFVKEHLDRVNFFDFPEKRMHLVSQLAMQNVVRRTGGPFAAAVFDETFKLVSVGVNVVLEEHASMAHAEIMAISLAQKRLKIHSLPACILTTNVQPCVMCSGAIFWAELHTVEWGAGSKEAEKIGFEEGTKYNSDILISKGTYPFNLTNSISSF